MPHTTKSHGYRDDTRRRLLRGAAAMTLLSLCGTRAGSATGGDDASGTPAFGPPEVFSFDRLTAKARQLAREPHQPRRAPAPEVVSKIDYDVHGSMNYDRDHALFARGASAYPVTFFPLGRLFPHPVRMYAVRNGEARQVRYRPELFDMPADSVARGLPDDAGFAGFRVHEAGHRDDWRTHDWTAFLGASYFRAIGALGQYGLSARGIAIDTATPDGEEFPTFTAFYIAPAREPGDPVIVHALLEGRSVTGAYRFALHRTHAVIMDVEARLFLRHDVARLGIAPATSMFWYSQHNRPFRKDWRPEIHDSDGLAIATGGGERIWRPLNNPRQPRVSSFLDRDPRGFGLLQRDRRFDHYLDGVHYERRPSLWIEPREDWGRGAVQLVELPTDDETEDNIVAFWVPEAPARAGDSYTFRYRLHWVAEAPAQGHELARCTGTWVGRGGQPGTERPSGVRKFVVSFAGPALDALGPEAQPEAVVTASRGDITWKTAERVPETARWRGMFDLAVSGTKPVELRLFLRLGERPLTETWLYQHLPALDGA